MIQIDKDNVRSVYLAETIEKCLLKNGIKPFYYEECISFIKKLKKHKLKKPSFESIKFACTLIKVMGQEVKIIVDKDDVVEILENISPREVRTYYTGNLSSAAYSIDTIAKLRDYAYIKYINDEVELVQKRIPEGRFEYLAIGVSKK